MSDREVRAGIQQAKNGEIGLNIITLEALAVGIAAGGIGHSWGLGAASFVCVGLPAHLSARYERAATLIATIMGVVWAVVAFIALTRAGASDGAAIVFPALAAAIGFSGHFWGFQALRDMRRARG
jgi:hypothetical protein